MCYQIYVCIHVQILQNPILHPPECSEILKKKPGFKIHLVNSVLYVCHSMRYPLFFLRRTKANLARAVPPCSPFMHAQFNTAPGCSRCRKFHADGNPCGDKKSQGNYPGVLEGGGRVKAMLGKMKTGREIEMLRNGARRIGALRE